MPLFPVSTPIDQYQVSARHSGTISIALMEG